MANPTTPPSKPSRPAPTRPSSPSPALLVVAAVVAFYALGQQDLWLRVAALLVLLVAAAATFFTSEPGKQLIAYGRDSVREVKKVVWPTRKEALQMTGYVFAFVVVMALFLWLTDKTLEWVLYDLDSRLEALRSTRRMTQRAKPRRDRPSRCAAAGQQALVRRARLLRHGEGGRAQPARADRPLGA